MIGEFAYKYVSIMTDDQTASVKVADLIKDNPQSD